MYEAQKRLRETLEHFKCKLNSERGLELAFAFICAEINVINQKIESNEYSEKKD